MESIRKILNHENFFIMLATVVSLVLVLVIFWGVIKASENRPIIKHDMGNNIHCYTFNNDISCLQLEK